MDSQRQLVFHAEEVGRGLRMGPVPVEAIPALSNHERVLDALAEGEPDWTLVFAVALHVADAQRFTWPLLHEFVHRARDPIEDLVYSTSRDAPKMVLDLSRPSIRFEHNPAWSRYVHSRIALAIMVYQDEPLYAIQLLEPLRDLFPPVTNDSLSPDVSFEGKILFWDLLRVLYGRAERFEDALSMFSPQIHSVFGGRDEEFAVAQTYFDGWLNQVTNESAQMSEYARFLSRIFSYGDLNQMDMENRDDLAECGKNTRQFWNWKFGHAVGTLVASKDHFRQSLVEEILSGDHGLWAWLAAGLLFEHSGSTDWENTRKLALGFYLSADEDYSGMGRPSSAPTVLHHSPQSDLYWAMRVGFADAMIAFGVGTKQPNLAEIKETVDRVESTSTAHYQRSMRQERSINEGLHQIERRLPVPPDHAVAWLQEQIGPASAHLPTETIGHLMQAVQARNRGTADDVRTSLAKAVESMFIELILRRLNPHVSPRDLAVEIPSRELGPYDVLRWNFISLWEWGAVLEALNREERLARLKARLSSAFTQIDFLALSQLSEPLRTVNGLRGSSSHHSREDLEDKQKRMDQMWSEVIGGVSDKGLVARLVDALGMVVQSSDGT